MIKPKTPSLETAFFSSHSCYTWYFPGFPSQQICRAGSRFHLCVTPKAGVTHRSILFPDLHIYLTSKHKPLNRLQIMQSSLENQVSSEVSGLKSKLSYITPKITFCILTAGIFIYSPPITCILNSLHYQHHHRAFFHIYSPLLLIFSFWSRARSLQGSASLLELTAGVPGAESWRGLLSRKPLFILCRLQCTPLSNHMEDSTQTPLSL